MPAKHKYQCLNAFCNVVYFAAMNAPTPECPRCRAIKLEDIGEVAYDEYPEGILQLAASHVSSGSVARIDKTLNGLANAYGLSDIKNSDGQAAKAYKSSPTAGKYGNLNVLGVDCPIGDTPSTHTGTTGYSPFSVSTGGKLSGVTRQPMNSVMSNTQVVAEHKAKA